MSRARDIADIQDNAGGAVAPFVAGKNKIINGDFGVWQRGTSFTIPVDTTTFSADRVRSNRNGTATVTISQQTFALGNTISGYEPQYFFRMNQATNGTGQTYSNFYTHRVEDVRTFAGQTVTLSFWAKADSTRTLGLVMGQYFGTGGSTTVYTTIEGLTLTTGWVRYSRTFTVPSIAGKTIGTGEVCLEINIQNANLNTAQTIDLWGVQWELGSVATPFTTATGTIQGELAACQRYYYRWTASATYSPVLFGGFYSTSQAKYIMYTPVTMRTAPSTLDYGGTFRLTDQTNYSDFTGMTLVVSTEASLVPQIIATASAASFANFRPAWLTASNSATAYIGLSAEL